MQRARDSKVITVTARNQIGVTNCWTAGRDAVMGNGNGMYCVAMSVEVSYFGDCFNARWVGITAAAHSAGERVYYPSPIGIEKPL